jgi:hypothetical protein
MAEGEPGVKFVNCTPHTVNVCGLVIPASGIVARVAEEIDILRAVRVNGVEIKLAVRRFGEIENLPEPEPGTLYITSALVAQAAWALGRRDVVHPACFERDAEGRIIGANCLIMGE